MDTQSGFLSLPREIRDIIYDYALEDVPFSDALTATTAYTPESFPLLYVDKFISEELQPLLYENHAMVIPIQSPKEYANGNSNFFPKDTKCSRMMKQRSKSLVIEMALITSVDDSEFGETVRFGGVLIPDILALKPELTGLKEIKLVFWSYSYSEDIADWSDPLKKLTEAWPEISLEVELNVFDFYDECAGDGGSNWIEGWDDWADEVGVCLEVSNLTWAEGADGKFPGRHIYVPAWKDEEFCYLNPDEQDKELHYCNFDKGPMYVNLALYDEEGPAFDNRRTFTVDFGDS
ncbi:hypothetical protein FHETE_3629 [Fusarium heterosporum]|uniref:Uncharacterized protein n=1 Tax=Fusarium heterosporum TaxID=42747 RepID=A0A8H5TNT5_FUSHE|nr:hypothetical protein FHETE_3629 [Fusarium heterosporum]